METGWHLPVQTFWWLLTTSGLLENKFSILVSESCVFVCVLCVCLSSTHFLMVVNYLFVCVPTHVYKHTGTIGIFVKIRRQPCNVDPCLLHCLRYGCLLYATVYTRKVGLWTFGHAPVSTFHLTEEVKLRVVTVDFVWTGVLNSASHTNRTCNTTCTFLTHPSLAQ